MARPKKLSPKVRGLIRRPRALFNFRVHDLRRLKSGGPKGKATRAALATPDLIRHQRLIELDMATGRDLSDLIHKERSNHHDRSHNGRALAKAYYSYESRHKLLKEVNIALQEEMRRRR